MGRLLPFRALLLTALFPLSSCALVPGASVEVGPSDGVPHVNWQEGFSLSGDDLLHVEIFTITTAHGYPATVTVTTEKDGFLRVQIDTSAVVLASDVTEKLDAAYSSKVESLQGARLELDDLYSDPPLSFRLGRPGPSVEVLGETFGSFHESHPVKNALVEDFKIQLLAGGDVVVPATFVFYIHTIEVTAQVNAYVWASFAPILTVDGPL